MGGQSRGGTGLSQISYVWQGSENLMKFGGSRSSLWN